MFATTRAGKRVDFFVQTRTYNIQEPMTSVKSRVDALTKDWGTPEIAAPNEFWRLHNVPDVIAGGYVSIRLIPGKRTISIGKGREGTESTWTTLEIEEYRPRTNSDPANEPGRGTVVINHINPAMSKVIQPISS